MSTVFLNDNQLYVAKASPTTCVGNDFAADDYDLKPTRAEITDLTVEYTDTSKYVTGDHTHDLVQPKTAKIAIDTDFDVQTPTFIATGSAGSATFASSFPITKKLNGAGCAVVSTDPTDETKNDGTVVITPSKQYDCATTCEAIYDVASCEDPANPTTGIEYKAKGMASTLVIEAPTIGEPLYYKFSAQGAVDGVKEVSPVPVLDDAKISMGETPRWRNATIEITELNLDGSDKTNGKTYSVCSNSFSLDTGNALSEIGCQTDEFGIKQYIITAKDPSIKITPLLEKISDYDWWTALNNASVYKIVITFYRDSAKTDKIAVVEVPRAQMIALSTSDDNGQRRQDQTFRCLRNSQGADQAEKEQVWSLTLFGTTDNQTS